ncbi:MAG: FliA/WhiG family RNA polymerase sigma factor [Clostridia bacterium]|nr:FliA/WhiG family RNA polymerase sigma factor [Clostridia bacterium]MDD4145548.1 FliA/WhiG family RNA polymerase sigma factor [Clostridia bacterium]MDD4664976.1 FliA/WhiG family RNA polymerase sigma factor [Clostridia bacterium]
MEPHNLWKEYLLNKAPAVKEDLIVHYIPLVQKIVKKMVCVLPAYMQQDDLFSYGILGLLEAIDRYNPNLGIPFAGFAVKRIKGAIIDGIRREDWFPVTVRKRAGQVEQAYQKIELQVGRNATDEEIASELGISLEELSKWLKTLQYITILSLDESFSEEQEVCLMDSLFNSESPNPLQITVEKEIKAILAKAIAGLPEKEKVVISLYYFHDLSNKEISQILELSPSRISQLHTKAIFRLRGKLSLYKKNLRKGERSG